jgi:hypothetical protein
MPPYDLSDRPQTGHRTGFGRSGIVICSGRQGSPAFPIDVNRSVVETGTLLTASLIRPMLASDADTLVGPSLAKQFPALLQLSIVQTDQQAMNEGGVWNFPKNWQRERMNVASDPEAQTGHSRVRSSALCRPKMRPSQTIRRVHVWAFICRPE